MSDMDREMKRALQVPYNARRHCIYFNLDWTLKELHTNLDNQAEKNIPLMLLHRQNL